MAYKCIGRKYTETDEPIESIDEEIPGGISEWKQPDSTNAYAKGDKVTHNGKTWVSDVDNNVWEPGVYGWSAVY